MNIGTFLKKSCLIFSLSIELEEEGAAFPFALCKKPGEQENSSMLCSAASVWVCLGFGSLFHLDRPFSSMWVLPHVWLCSNVNCSFWKEKSTGALSRRKNKMMILDQSLSKWFEEGWKSGSDFVFSCFVFGCLRKAGVRTPFNVTCLSVLQEIVL